MRGAVVAAMWPAGSGGASANKKLVYAEVAGSALGKVGIPLVGGGVDG
jgi:hypothetical protein